MIFVALMLAVFVVYFIQSRIYSERIFTLLSYRAYFGCEESAEGDTVYFYEEITNKSSLPVPNAKVSTVLPEGLSFTVTDKKSGQLRREQSVQSVFVLRGKATVRRKWRVRCDRRGVYEPQAVLMVINNLFGTDAVSKNLEFAAGNEVGVRFLTVFPNVADIADAGTENEYILGDKSVLLGMIEDPLQQIGIREYRDGDPQNAFNWAATAAHDRLLVNRYEFTRERKFNIILNLCSRDNERDLHIPAVPEITEDSVRVCASLLDRAIQAQSDVRLIVNAPSDTRESRRLWLESPYRSLSREEREMSVPVFGEFTALDAENDVFVSRPFCGKHDTLDALRALAELPPYYSCTLERLLETVSDGGLPELLDGSFVVVTPYVNERILEFYTKMLKRGIRVAFYLTSSQGLDISAKETDAEIVFVRQD